MKNLVRGLLHHCLLYLVIHSLKFFLSANGFSLLLTKIQLIERKKKRRGEEKGGYKMLSITAFALFMQLCFSQNGGYSCFYILWTCSMIIMRICIFGKMLMTIMKMLKLSKLREYLVRCPRSLHHHTLVCGGGEAWAPCVGITRTMNNLSDKWVKGFPILKNVKKEREKDQVIYFFI